MNRDDAMESLGQQIDRLDSAVAGLALPISAETHLEGLRGLLPEIRDEMKRRFVEASGFNPWETHPYCTTGEDDD